MKQESSVLTCTCGVWCACACACAHMWSTASAGPCSWPTTVPPPVFFTQPVTPTRAASCSVYCQASDDVTLERRGASESSSQREPEMSSTHHSEANACKQTRRKCQHSDAKLRSSSCLARDKADKTETRLAVKSRRTLNTSEDFKVDGQQLPSC